MVEFELVRKIHLEMLRDNIPYERRLFEAVRRLSTDHGVVIGFESEQADLVGRWLQLLWASERPMDESRKTRTSLFQWSMVFLISLLIVMVTDVLVRYLNVYYPDIAWAPKIGAVIVGTSIFFQGLLIADELRWRYRFSDGVTLRQLVMQYSHVAVIWGTIFAAFGEYYTPVILEWPF